MDWLQCNAGQVGEQQTPGQPACCVLQQADSRPNLWQLEGKHALTPGWLAGVAAPCCCSVLGRVHAAYAVVKDRAERAEVRLEMAESQLEQERGSAEAYKVYACTHTQHTSPACHFIWMDALRLPCCRLLRTEHAC